MILGIGGLRNDGGQRLLTVRPGAITRTFFEKRVSCGQETLFGVCQSGTNAASTENGTGTIVQKNAGAHLWRRCTKSFQASPPIDQKGRSEGNGNGSSLHKRLHRSSTKPLFPGGMKFRAALGDRFQRV